ncbi:uncharacterized protein LOC116402160 isoform X2 [Cucumis sativus]|uniref:uncharacterized protein LOC116402160 isoform X2 n=1 Tax=Cucumis sativus TaxID=3659 RepID=UPI0012F51F09|nr:uncharacterized protein LOC116402160 isoform X2 [Cucumis sativus]
MGRDFMVSNGKSSCVFKGKIFCFSSSFPEDRRAEIVEWINQGGGEVVEDHMKQKVHFTVECHGGIPRSTDVHSTYVSSHRVRSCLEIFPPDCSLVGQDHSETSPIGALSNQWSKRAERKEDVGNSTTEDGTVGICDGFSETQTESQVDDGEWELYPQVTALCIGNAKYFGGGMKIVQMPILPTGV